MPLKGKNELERFTEKYGYTKIWSALEKRINDFQSDFRVDICNNFALHDIDLKFTHNLNADGSSFEFDAVYEVYASFTDEYSDEQIKSQWFAARCAAEVDETFKSFEVMDICIYARTSKDGNTTPNFVPVISKKQMDEDAVQFLRDNYPQALREPTQVPIHDIARRIGLNLEFGYMLSEDFSFFGQISFSDTKTRVFDVETGESCELDVTRGTILIDPEVFWERSAGCENFTIAHEVVHWEKHKLFADIKRLLYGCKYMAQRCPKPREVFIDSDDKWSDEEWLEWHANGIGARILMPKETVPQKINEIIAGFSDDLMSNKAEYYIKLIDSLADFYGTSRQMTKRRLKELGYNEVERIQLHEYDYNIYTHEIDEYKAYYELCASDELRMLVCSGYFTYADKHFVINNEKCIEYDDDGVPHLTNFARDNLEVCTLKFTNVRVNIRERNGFSDILYRGKTYETFQKYNCVNNEAAFEFARELAAEFTAKAPERQKLKTTFTQMVIQIMNVKNIGATEFQELTLMSKSTYHRFRRENIKLSFRSILAFCAGLDLDIITTNELLRKAGYAFDGSEAHMAYMTAITAFSGKSIDVRNEFLSNLKIEGVATLGDEIKETE